MNEQAAQVLVAAFRDAHQHSAVAAGELSRDKADPGGEMPTVPELRTIADGGDNGRRSLRANTFDPGDALTDRAVAEDRLDLLVKGCNPPVKVAEEIVELSEGFAGE